MSYEEMVVNARLSQCTPCELNIDGTCAACGCLVKEKVYKLDERCPLNPPKWISISSFSLIVEEQPQTVSAECMTCQKKK